ncbi:LysR substrate-binding domain-containing protein [Accumulibacter sp.]|uniref:LysR substrate-binding domain-containing protein n=1 Tax=Accumulibacter sp. TaxID=2053492 RepID=UPI0033906AB1
MIAPLGHWAAEPLHRTAGAERRALHPSRNGFRVRAGRIDTHLAQIGVKLAIKMSVNSNEAIRDLVASGMGLAVLFPTRTADESCERRPVHPRRAGIPVAQAVAGDPSEIEDPVATGQSVPR